VKTIFLEKVWNHQCKKVLTFASFMATGVGIHTRLADPDSGPGEQNQRRIHADPDPKSWFILQKKK
jgi:hypothetical protein